MCVLTYIPLAEGFILTSNRDEAVARVAAVAPKKYRIGNESVFYPKDPQGGGTWIATHQRFTLCLLNGATEKHNPNPPYRHSRGRIVTDFFHYLSVNDFIRQYNFEQIEPFTLVIIDDEDSENIYQIRWNGKETAGMKLDRNTPRIWSSVTLYSPEVVAYRELCFDVFLQEKQPETETLLDFHRFGGGNDPENKLLMNRNNTLKTISLTQILKTEENYTIFYEDLVQNKKYQYRILQEAAMAH